MPYPLHPALVHLPLGLALTTPILAIGIALAAWRGFLPRRAWIAAVALQTLLLAGGVADLLAGEKESRRVEKVIGKDPVEEHEDRAEAFLWAAGAVLSVSAAALVVPAVAGGPLVALSLAGMIAVAVLAIRTGSAGGDLVYRYGAARAYGAGTAAGGEAREAEHGENGKR